MIACSGAGGFIGSHLVQALIGRGTAVRALLGPTDPEPIDPHRGSPVAERLEVRGDIRDPDVVGRWIEGCHTVVHLAGPASVAGSFADPLGTLDVHVLGTAAVVEAARRSRVDHIVLVSSAEVYGFQELQPVPETAVLAPRSPYGAAKVGAEAVLGAATRSGWFDSTVLRPFSVYGPGQPGHTLLSQLVAAAVAGRRVSVVDPSPVRDFVFVGDVVEAVLAACDRSRSSGSRTRSHLCCNVASGQGRSVGEVAEMVSERFGTGEAPEVAGATRPSDIPMLVGDTARASMVLGVEASTLFADGLELTVDAIGERLH